MPKFNYEAIQSDGSIVQGTMDFESQMALAEKLHRDGLMVIAITDNKIFGKAKTGESLQKKLFENFLPEKLSKLVLFDRLAKAKVKFMDLLFFLTQLSSMIGGGLNLVSVLTSLAEDVENRKFRAVLQRVIQALKDGQSFSDAISVYPKIFDDVFVSLVKAGEVSGKLDRTLKEATLYMEKTMNMRQKVKQATLYPIIIVCVFIVISIILITVIVPQFKNLFDKLGGELPAPTKVLITVNSLILDHTFTTLFTLLVLGVSIAMILKIESVRYVVDGFLLRVPLFGPLAKKAILAKFARTLGILFGSGVSTITALEQLKKISSNRVIQNAILLSIEDVKIGKSVSEALTERGIFPKLVIQMTSSGEDAGTLPEMLGKVADHYETQVEFQVNTLSTVIEPIMILVMAVVVAGLLFAIYLPIFKLGQVVKGM